MTRLLLSLAFAASCAACATILDFQEPTDKVSSASLADGGLGPSSTAAGGSTALDAASATPDSATPAPASGGTTAGGDDDASTDASVDPGPPVNLCVCSGAVPTDWQGPFVIATATSGAPAPCGGAYATEVYTGFGGAGAPPAQCTCSCGAPTGVACSTPATTLFGDAQCQTTCTTDTGPLACVAVGSYTCNLLGVTKPRAMTVSASVASGGACQPSATASVPPVTWASTIRLCGGASLACDDGGCPVAPNAGFSATNRCVMKPGDNMCPPGYPVKQLLHETGTDTRACSPCTCGAPADVACAASVATFGGTACSGQPTASAVAPTDCLTLPGQGHFSVASAAPQGGSCAPSGGVATGAFTADAPTTVCCLQ